METVCFVSPGSTNHIFSRKFSSSSICRLYQRKLEAVARRQTHLGTFKVSRHQGRSEGGAKGAICPGPQLKGAPHKKGTKYAVKMNSNTLTDCTIFLFLGPQISKFSRGRMAPDPPLPLSTTTR